MRKSLAAVSVFAVIALAGCGVSASPSNASKADDTSSSSAKGDAKDAAEAEQEDGTQAFGKGYKWDDGLQVAVSKPTKYTPSSTAATGAGAKYFVKFIVTIKNGTDAPFDPSVFSATASIGEDEAEQVFDSSKGINGSPETKILKGKSKKFPLVYGAKKKGETVLEVSPDFGTHDSVLFQG